MTKPLTQAELAAIKAVWARATPGPWKTAGLDKFEIDGELEWVIDDADGSMLAEIPTGTQDWEMAKTGRYADTATAIAAAPTHIGALLDEVERLNELIASEGLHPACMAIADTNANLAAENQRLRGAIDYAISTTDEWVEVDSLHELNRNLRTVLRGIAGEVPTSST